MLAGLSLFPFESVADWIRDFETPDGLPRDTERACEAFLSLLATRDRDR